MKPFDMKKPGCCRNMWQPQHKDVRAVKIYREEVLYDVAYALWKKGQMLDVQGKNQQKFEITRDDKDWFDRQLDTAIMNVKEKVRWAVTNNVARMVSDELNASPDEYNIVFGFSGCRWLGSPNNLANDIHNYVVNYILSSWYSMSNMVDLVSFYTAQAKDFLRRTHGEVNEIEMIEPRWRPLRKD